MNKLLEHAKEELKLAGYDISEVGCNPKNPKDPMDGYANSCAKNAYELLEVFSKAGHSGMSAGLTLAIFNKLANWGNLTPLTNNPNEWMKLGGSTDEFWQNRRNSSCFSKDLKFYYDLDEKENYNYDKDGGKTFKPRSEWIYHELKEYK